MTNPARPAGPATPFEVIVIGGGLAGLAIAGHLHRQGRRFLVLDAGPEIEDDVAGHLAAYVAAFDLPVLLSSPVTELARAGDHFEVRTTRRSYFAHQVVVAAGPDYSWITIPGVVSDGRIVHERGVSAIPGIYVIGLPWPHTRGSALLGNADADAKHIAERIARTEAARAESSVS